MVLMGFPGGSVVKNPPANAGGTGDTDSIPGSERSPGGGNGNPVQYSCLAQRSHQERTEEPGGLQSIMGSLIVGQDLATEHSCHQWY